MGTRRLPNHRKGPIVKIYAIRDRLLDYYMQPFAGPEDKAVLASIAAMINRQGEQSDIAQAPHHFEIWKIGVIIENGNIQPCKELLATAESLVRPAMGGEPPKTGPGTPATTGGPRNAQERSDATPLPANARPGTPEYRETDRILGRG